MLTDSRSSILQEPFMVEKSESKLFLSYAHIDNQPLPPGGPRWVDQLANALQTLLRRMSGESVQIFMNSSSIASHSLDRTVEYQLRSASLLICVLSPSYVRSAWCMQEFKSFIRLHGTSVKTSSGSEAPTFICIEKYPVDRSELPPEMLDSVMFRFFDIAFDSPAIYELSPHSPKAQEQRYWLALNELAHVVKKQLATTERYPAATSEPAPELLSTVGVGAPSAEGRRLLVFLCHSSADKAAVRNLCDKLEQDGFDPWLDERKLLPGQKWAEEIPKAVKASDVVIVCLSTASITRRGYVQRELGFALDIALEQPEGAIYLVPARLEECEVPERIKPYHWVNLFEDQGYGRLLRSLEASASRLSVASAAESHQPQ